MVARCGGGFFHTPPGLLAGSPAGEATFFSLGLDNRNLGIALGVQHPARGNSIPHRLGWNRGARDIYFPTVPALAPGIIPRDVMGSLKDTLQAINVSEARFDSYDAPWCPTAEVGGEEPPPRTEYVLALTSGADAPAALAQQASAHHRRHIRRGERDGWTMRALQGEEARQVLALTLRTASERARKRGDGFTAGLATIATHARANFDEPWGVLVWSVWDDGGPLAAAAIGYANRRGYYISGGSTPRGYARDASVWMQYRISCILSAAGFVTYNLGGTVAGANASTHRAHGLYRFKRGFGAVVKRCAGIRWRFAEPTAQERVSEWLEGRRHS
jgi:hypothetical protein